MPRIQRQLTLAFSGLFHGKCDEKRRKRLQNCNFYALTVPIISKIGRENENFDVKRKICATSRNDPTANRQKSGFFGRTAPKIPDFALL